MEREGVAEPTCRRAVVRWCEGEAESRCKKARAAGTICELAESSRAGLRVRAESIAGHWSWSAAETFVPDWWLWAGQWDF